MTTTVGQVARSPSTPVNPGAVVRRPGRGFVSGVGPVRQHPPGLRNPVAHLHRLVRRGGPHVPARRALTVAHYVAARAGSGASIATLRLATSAISKATSGPSWNRPAGTRACAPL